MSQEHKDRCRRIAECSRAKPLPVVPVYFIECSDGNWYSPWGVPYGVQATGNRRVNHYALRAKNGTTVGNAKQTAEEVENEQAKRIQARVDDFYIKLLDMSEDELARQEEYWNKNKGNG